MNEKIAEIQALFNELLDVSARPITDSKCRCEECLGYKKRVLAIKKKISDLCDAAGIIQVAIKDKATVRDIRKKHEDLSREEKCHVSELCYEDAMVEWGKIAVEQYKQQQKQVKCS